jgi:hypothetical protein
MGLLNLGDWTKQKLGFDSKYKRLNFFKTLAL